MTLFARVWLGIVCLLTLLAIGVKFSHAGWKPEYAASSPQIREWFEQQKDRTGRSCCAQADGHYYDGNYTLNPDGSVTVSLHGKPHTLAPETVINSPNPTGRAIWWYYEVGDIHTDFCFSPGTLS